MNAVDANTLGEPIAWDTEILGLLGELSSVQTDLLELLAEKRQLLAAGDCERLALIQTREQDLIDRLLQCQQRRQQLLDLAAEEGLPNDNLQSLAKKVPCTNSRALNQGVEEARRRARLLQHQSITNWVLVQRTLLHLSHLVEIIATGGRMKPTYGTGSSGSTGGTLVDRAV